MKFSFNYIISLIVFIAQFSLFAQNSSTYSRLGIGDMSYNYSAVQLGMGQLGAAVSGDHNINILNPAGWNNFMLTRVDFGFNYSGLFLSGNSSSTYYGKGKFNGFTFAFPVSRAYGIGVAMGLIPYSDISYTVAQNYIVDNTQNYNVTYEGSGGLSKLFIGSSYRLPFGLNIGAALNYYFGTMNYNSTVNFNSGKNVQAEYKKTYNPSGLGSTVGLISPDFSSIFNSKKVTDFRIGLALDMTGNLKTDTLLVSSSNISIDTLGKGAVKMKIPFRLDAGLSLHLKDSYLLTLDYLYQPWNNYSLNNIHSTYLRSATKISVGFQFVPVYSPELSFWEQFSWRAGLSFEKTQYSINGTGINQYSVSGGFSLPLSFANTLDVGIQYSIRGTTRTNLFKENTVKLDVGISLGELWFIRHRE